MGKKRPNTSPPPITGIEYTKEFAGLVPGDFFRVHGERGKFKFMRLARGLTHTEWVEAWDKDGSYRAFKPEKVKV